MNHHCSRCLRILSGLVSVVLPLCLVENGPLSGREPKKVQRQRPDEPNDGPRNRLESIQPDAKGFRWRFTAEWADGTRTSAANLTNWQYPKLEPKLDGRSLMDPKNPVRWLHDNTQPRPSQPEAYLEFYGGDRFPGRLVGHLDASAPTQPAVDAPRESREAPPLYESSVLASCAIVEPGVSIGMPGIQAVRQFRVRTEWLRRVHWRGSTDRPYQPGTIFAADGRTIPFRSLRWNNQGLRLLTETGTATIDYDQIDELHLPRLDCWKAHFQQLAVMCPDASGRLMRLVAQGGLRATTSVEQFHLVPKGRRDQLQGGFQFVQPAWSLDGFFVADQGITDRSWFATHEVPLTWIEPLVSVHRASLSQAWDRARIDSSAQGGPLLAAGMPFGWGWGVHADHELVFPLPACATALHTRLALDQVAGAGGCAQAKIYCGGDLPLFESPLLIGTQKVHDVGRLSLPLGAGASPQLKLVADSVRDAPAGADPLDIRDAVDWLEPIVELDPAGVRTEVKRYLMDVLPGLAGWTIAGEQGVAWRLENTIDAMGHRAPLTVLALEPLAGSLVFSRSVLVQPGANSLAIFASSAREVRGGGVQVAVTVNGQAAAQAMLPHSQGKLPPPAVVVSLAEFEGRQVKLEVHCTPKHGQGIVHWHGAQLGDGRTMEPAEKPSAR